MSLEQLIAERLASLEPESLMLDDESSQHTGHAGNSGGGHYHLTLVSAAFTGLNAVARHRLVYGRLSDLIPHRIHALSIKAYAPDEL